MTPMNTANLATVNRMLAAAAEVFELALRQVETEGPGSLAGVQRLADAGGMLRLTINLAPSTRLAQVFVAVSEPNGEVHQLLGIELDNPALN